MRPAVLLLIISLCAGADTLILRSGERVSGRWWATDAKMVSFLVDGHLESYPRSDVSEVIFGAGPSADSVNSPVPKPGQIGTVYFQAGAGNLLELERAQAAGHRESGGQYWTMPGERSSFRLNGDSRMQLLVEMPSGVAPSSVHLYPLETKRNTRRTKAGNRNGPALTIPFTTTQVAENTYVLTPAGTLTPGEYAFSPAYSNDVFCFGVDPTVAGTR
jgi:hypothetical protein